MSLTYDSARLATGYAYSRPPLHPHVMRMAAERLHITQPYRRGLDVGCGAGRSTEALGLLAGITVGLEPVRAMLAHSRAVAPLALFSVGRAEELPFRSRSFDIITSAGALNYVDLPRFLPNAARVLTPGGVLVIYDFSTGRRFSDGEALDRWFADFERRYPFPPDHDLDVKAIDYTDFGLRLLGYQQFEVALNYGARSFLEYMLSEANVELAIRQGVSEDEIRDWCYSTLEPVFGGRDHDVQFDGYIAYVCREGGEN